MTPDDQIIRAVKASGAFDVVRVYWGIYKACTMSPRMKPIAALASLRKWQPELFAPRWRAKHRPTDDRVVRVETPDGSRKGYRNLGDREIVEYGRRGNVSQGEAYSRAAERQWVRDDDE